MIGVVVVSHGLIGSEMVRVAKSIVRTPFRITSIALEHDEDVGGTQKKIAAAIEEVKTTEGVLLLTDMFGGTPSNICLSFLEEGKVEVITGVNLPMILKLAHFGQEKPLGEVARFIKDYGQKNITLAGEVLKGS